MKFGILYEIEKVQPWGEDGQRLVFTESLEQIKLAEKVGFEYVWEVEHHFLASSRSPQLPRCSCRQ